MLAASVVPLVTIRYIELFLEYEALEDALTLLTLNPILALCAIRMDT